MRVLLTGGAGFIGSHVADRLLDESHEVFVLDNLSAGVNFVPHGAEFLRGNIEHVSEATLPTDIAAIVHCAARADISANWESTAQRAWLERTNIGGTTNMLEAMGPKCQAFILLSTCAVYNDSSGADENTLPVITSPYAASKLAAEAYVAAYCYAKNVRGYSLRLGCAVGARYHHGHVADFVHMARTDALIHAKSDGRVRKSFVHVADIAEAVSHCLTGNRDLGERAPAPPGVYNVAASPWSWRDTLEVMGELAGGSVPFEYESREKGWVGDPMALVSNAKLLGSGWMPKRTITEGVAEALQFLGWGR